jgi:hypothetical protein
MNPGESSLILRSCGMTALQRFYKMIQNEFYASAFRCLLLPSIEQLLEEIPGRRSKTAIALTPENIAIVKRRCEDLRPV